jgi:hypothetical protein
MKANLKKPIIALFLLLLFQKINAQVFGDSCRVRILTEHDEIIFGKIVWHTDSMISLQTFDDNRLDIPVSEIYRIQFYGKNRPLRTFDTQRNSFASSGYLLEKGQFYFQNVAIYYNHAAYGIRKNWMIQATGSLITEGFMVSCGAKYQLPFLKNLGATSVGFGQISGQNRGSTIVSGIGFYASVAHTWGSLDRQMTVGLAKLAGKFLPKQYPAVQFSAKIKLSKRRQLIAENFIYPDFKNNQNEFFMLGLRLFGRNKALFDFGFCYILKYDAATDRKSRIPLPYLSVHFIGQDGRDVVRWW